LRFLHGLQFLRSFLQHLRMLGYANANLVFVFFIFTLIIPICVVFTPTPIPRETPEPASTQRPLLLLRQHRTVRVRLRARPCLTPASAEKRKAHVGTVMCKDPRAELRIVSRADHVCRCAAHELHLLFIRL
jgi:hypothetical protein